jgi:hypothetical protein
VDKTLWPHFQRANDELRRHLDEIAERVIDAAMEASAGDEEVREREQQLLPLTTIDESSCDLLAVVQGGYQPLVERLSQETTEQDEHSPQHERSEQEPRSRVGRHDWVFVDQDHQVLGSRNHPSCAEEPEQRTDREAE